MEGSFLWLRPALTVALPRPNHWLCWRPRSPVLLVFLLCALCLLVPCIVAHHTSIPGHVPWSYPRRTHRWLLPPMLLLLTSSAGTTALTTAAATSPSSSSAGGTVAPIALSSIEHRPLSKGVAVRAPVTLMVLLNSCDFSLFCSHVLCPGSNYPTALLTWFRYSSRRPPIRTMILSHLKACCHPARSASSTLMITMPRHMRRPSFLRILSACSQMVFF